MPTNYIISTSGKTSASGVGRVGSPIGVAVLQHPQSIFSQNKNKKNREWN